MLAISEWDNLWYSVLLKTSKEKEDDMYPGQVLN